MKQKFCVTDSMALFAPGVVQNSPDVWDPPYPSPKPASCLVKLGTLGQDMFPCFDVDPSTMEVIGSGSEPSLDDGSLQCLVIGQCSLPDDVGLVSLLR